MRQRIYRLFFKYLDKVLNGIACAIDWINTEITTRRMT